MHISRCDLLEMLVEGNIISQTCSTFINQIFILWGKCDKLDLQLSGSRIFIVDIQQADIESFVNNHNY